MGAPPMAFAAKNAERLRYTSGRSALGMHAGDHPEISFSDPSLCLLGASLRGQPRPPVRPRAKLPTTGQVCLLRTTVAVRIRLRRTTRRGAAAYADANQCLAEARTQYIGFSGVYLLLLCANRQGAPPHDDWHKVQRGKQSG